MDSDNENQDKLIPSTSNFEALRAIYDPEFETDENTKCHDNVEKCVAFLEGRWRQKPKKVENPNPEPEVKLERQFLPEQLPVATRGRKPLRNVVKRMEDFNSTSGPLFVLKQCREEKKRVRVWMVERYEITQSISLQMVIFNHSMVKNLFIAMKKSY